MDVDKHATLEDWYDRLDKAGCNPQRRGDQIRALCPSHKDTNPSLSVTRGKVVPVIAKCHAGCTFERIRRDLGFIGGGDPKRRYVVRETEPATNGKYGFKQPKIFWFAELPKDQFATKSGVLVVEAIYEYRNFAGSLIGAIVRFRNENGKKEFKQARYEPAQSPNSERPWRWGGLRKPTPLYKIEKIKAELSRDVWVVEGEKAVHKIVNVFDREIEDDLDKPHIVCWAGGASAWHKAEWEPLTGRSVFVLSDADDPGRKAAHGIGAHIKDMAKAVNVVTFDGDDGKGWDDIIESHGLLYALEYIEKNGVEPLGKALVSGGQFEYGGYKKVYNVWDTKKSMAFWEAMEREGIKLRFNARSAKREIKQGNSGWQSIRGVRQLEHLRQFIADNYGWRKRFGSAQTEDLKFSNNEFKSLLHSHDYLTEVDTFYEYLNGLPAWDGVPRVLQLLSTLFHNHPSRIAVPLDHPYAQWASKFLFLAPIQLTCITESNNDQDRVQIRPLFIGDKWIGKSAMLQVLFPEEYPEWFSSSFTICNSDKEMVQSILGKVVVEVGEMSGLSPNTREKWQQFSSRNVDHVRLTYRPDSEAFPRRCVLICTSNSMAPLPYDPAGWRRDLPILLGKAKGAVEPYFEEHRDQLWAEGMTFFDQGDRVLIPVHDRRELMQYIAQFQERDDIHGELIEKLPLSFTQKTTAELLVLAGACKTPADVFKLHKQHVKGFKDALREAGCEYVKWRPANHVSFTYGWNRDHKDL